MAAIFEHHQRCALNIVSQRCSMAHRKQLVFYTMYNHCGTLYLLQQLSRPAISRRGRVCPLLDLPEIDLNQINMQKHQIALVRACRSLDGSEMLNMFIEYGVDLRSSQPGRPVPLLGYNYNAERCWRRRRHSSRCLGGVFNQPATPGQAAGDETSIYGTHETSLH